MPHLNLAFRLVNYRIRDAYRLAQYSIQSILFLGLTHYTTNHYFILKYWIVSNKRLEFLAHGSISSIYLYIFQMPILLLIKCIELMSNIFHNLTK